MTDELALQKAKETLVLEGKDLDKWKPNEDDRTKSPDGVPDSFLVRNALDSNKGFIVFYGPENSGIQVSLELKGNKLQCQSFTMP